MEKLQLLPLKFPWHNSLLQNGILGRRHKIQAPCGLILRRRRITPSTSFRNYRYQLHPSLRATRVQEFDVRHCGIDPIFCAGTSAYNNACSSFFGLCGALAQWPVVKCQHCNPLLFRYGRLAERLKAPVLKTGRGASLSWVRIPHLPPIFASIHAGFQPVESRPHQNNLSIGKRRNLSVEYFQLCRRRSRLPRSTLHQAPESLYDSALLILSLPAVNATLSTLLTV